MGETKSIEDGTFFVAGNETEVTQIDPKINIYHNCEDEARVNINNMFEIFQLGHKFDLGLFKKFYLILGDTCHFIFST